MGEEMFGVVEKASYERVIQTEVSILMQLCRLV